MKRIDFENGNTTSNLLNAAFPMLIAQLLALLYNIVDRIYIARIPDIGTTALGAVGLCFPIIVIITAFANLLGTGGAPIFSICRGKKDVEHARQIMGISFTLLCGCSLILICRHAPCKSSSRIIRCLQRCAKICLSISDDLSDWNTSIHDHYRDESIYQRSGICCCRYVFRYNRSCCKHYFRPNFYLCISLRCSGSRNCNRHLSGCICRICALFSKTPRRDQSPAFFAPQNALLHC